MTVSSQTSNETFYGNGSTTVWDLPFRFFDNSDVDVYLIDPATGIVTPLALGTDYTLTGAGLPEQFGNAPGQITTTVPVASGKQLYVERVMEVEQLTDIVNQGRFFPEVHEDVFDRITMLIQQTLSWLSRALVWPVGKNYYDAEGRKISNLGDGAADQDAVNIRTMRGYVDAAISGVVGGFGWFLQSGVGAVYRTFQSKMRASLSSEDFGSIGDGTYHPLSSIYSTLELAKVQYPFVTSLSQSVDWAACQAALNAANGRAVELIGRLVITDTLDTAGALRIFGGGVADWVPGYNELITDGGTQLWYYGTGARIHTVDNISSRVHGGGSISNPASASPYTANAPVPTYSTLDFTNADAVGASRATLRGFSVGLYRRKGCRIENLRMVPYFNGIAGYQDGETGGMGSDWDVGVWDESARATFDDNLQVVGYWRMRAYLKTCSQLAPSVTPVAETSTHRRSTFQNGIAVRGNDTYRITARTADTLEIPWSASHRFPATGTVRTGGVEYAYTGLGFAADKLTFTGVTPSAAGVVVGTDLRIGGSNFGTSGTQFDDSYITGLDHSSRLLSTCVELSSPLPFPSVCIELGGSPCRAIQFTNCTVITRDDVLVFAPDCEDLIYSGTYFESQPGRSSLGVGIFTGDIPAGSRMIYERASTSVRAPYPSGGTRRMISGPTTTYGPGVDLRPDIEGVTVPRYTVGGGLATARDYVDFPSSFPTTSDGDINLLAPNRHVRVRPGANGTVFVGPTTGGDANVQSAVNSLNLRSGLRIRIGSPTIDWYIADAAKFNPVTDDTFTCGATTLRWSALHTVKVMYSTTGGDFFGTGSPEGVVTASPGSTFRRNNGGAGTAFYVKESGTGNTGWIAK
jgi:hypothetical protein